MRDKAARTRRRMATGVAAAGLAVLALTGGGVATAAPAEVAADCQTYWPSPFQVCDQIKDLYNSLGGAASPLGFPSSAAQAYGTDGLRQTFTGGAIVWTPSTGAYIE